MEARPLARALLQSGARPATTTTTKTSTTATHLGRRHQATTSRHKKALKVAPHASFRLPDAGASHVVYNPPSSAASVYHTPFKFLPPTDPRRRASLPKMIRQAAAASSVAPQAQPGKLPPVMRRNEHARAAAPAYNVTREQVEEIREKRAADPAHNSVARLAWEYGCSKLFIMMCTDAPREHKLAEQARKQAILDREGPIRTKARADRAKRQELLLRGQL